MAVLLASLMVAVFVRVILLEAWYYTYAMGFAGLLSRLLAYLLLLSLPILAVLWERGASRRKRQPSRTASTAAVGADGKVVRQHTQRILGEPDSPKRSKRGALTIFLGVCCAGLVVYLGILPTIMDLFSEPVTQDLFLVVRYSRSTMRGGPPGRYYLAAYDSDGEPVTTGSWKSVSLRANLRFSAFESIQSASGAVELSFPPNRWGNRPRNGDYALFSATVTYYPHSRTRVGFANVQFYLPENFPPERPERAYYGPDDVDGAQSG